MLSSTTTTLRKAMCAVLVSNELARIADTDGVIGTELRNATVAAIDQQFISIASSGVVATNSVGSSAAAFFDDLGVAINSVSTDANSRFYLIMGAANARQLSVLLAESASPSTMMSARRQRLRRRGAR